MLFRAMQIICCFDIPGIESLVRRPGWEKVRRGWESPPFCESSIVDLHEVLTLAIATAVTVTCCAWVYLNIRRWQW